MMEPAVIRKLDEATVNRMAAGEVVIRPSFALKELIENSIDAKATTIQITIRNGVQFIEIQDNGTGIRKDDLPILCERFTTSKLQKVEDLQTILTYGFRGEALCSISQVSYLSVQTKVRDQLCAYKAQYESGRLKGPVKTCAGNQGTRITIEKLFFNLPSRLKSLKAPGQEEKLMGEVVMKYAVHNSKISFGCQFSDQKSSFRTQMNSSHIDCIRALYGPEIGKQLLEIKINDDHLKYKCTGYVTNSTFSIKKMILLLFINNRLVESPAIKKMLDEIYFHYLEKGGKPFVYLSLEVEPQNIDVNVHPTKSEVIFLHQDTIVEKIRHHIEEILKGKSNEKSYQTQSLLPGAKLPSQVVKSSPKETNNPKNLARMDSSIQKLDKFLHSTPNSSSYNTNDSLNVSMTREIKSKRGIEEVEDEESLNDSITVDSERKVVTLTSVSELLSDIEGAHHRVWRQILSDLVFVGHLNPSQVLIQQNTELYLCNTVELAEELFYQRTIVDIQNYGILTFETPYQIQELAMIALQELNVADTQPSSNDDLAAQAKLVETTLISKSAILKEYFNIVIEDGKICSIPLLVEKHVPPLLTLPSYILNLALCVNWDDEKICFETFAQITGRYYGTVPSVEEKPAEEWKRTVEHVLYPAIKQYLYPSQDLASSNAIIKLTSLPDLYKIFERC